MRGPMRIVEESVECEEGAVRFGECGWECISSQHNVSAEGLWEGAWVKGTYPRDLKP